MKNILCLLTVFAMSAVSFGKTTTEAAPTETKVYVIGSHTETIFETVAKEFAEMGLSIVVIEAAPEASEIVFKLTNHYKSFAVLEDEDPGRLYEDRPKINHEIRSTRPDTIPKRNSPRIYRSPRDAI